jgi:hypothetical protein
MSKQALLVCSDILFMELLTEIQRRSAIGSHILVTPTDLGEWVQERVDGNGVVAQSLTDRLVEHLSSALNEHVSAEQRDTARIVPFVVSVAPGEQLQWVIAPDRISADTYSKMYEVRLRQLAQLAPIPDYLLTGLANRTYANGAIEHNQGVTQFWRPTANRIAGELTDWFLQDFLGSLVDAGVWGGDPLLHRVVPNLLVIEERVSQWQEVLASLNAGLVSFASVRRRLNWSESDAAGEKDLLLLRELGHRGVPTGGTGGGGGVTAFTG